MASVHLQAGKLLRTEGFKFDLAYTSVLKRAIKTLQNVLEELDQLWVPVEKSWRLNERHYGDLQGRNKADTAKKFGAEQVHIWRRSYDVPPAGQACWLKLKRQPVLVCVKPCFGMPVDVQVNRHAAAGMHSNKSLAILMP